MDLTRKDEAEGGAALSLSFLLRSFSVNFLVLFWTLQDFSPEGLKIW